MIQKILDKIDLLRLEVQCVWLRRTREFVWKIIHRVHPKHRYHVVKTGLKPGYYDPDVRILYSNMNLMKEFVEITKDTVDWDSDEGHQHAWNELQDIYKWWEGYEELLESRDKALNSPNYEEYFDFENRVHDEEQKMLIRLMKIRRYMWYP